VKRLKQFKTNKMKNLETLSGNQLAELLIKFDSLGMEIEAILVESELDFRYEQSFKHELIERMKK